MLRISVNRPKTIMLRMKKLCRYSACNRHVSPRIWKPVGSCRWHGGHSHSHDEHDAEALEKLKQQLSAEDARAADRITWLGVYVNVGLAAVKGVAGFACHSSGLVADAAHSMSDMISDGVTLIALKFCSKEPDKSHPYGYGRYETVGALTVATLLVGGSLGIVIHSFDNLLTLYQVASPEIAEVAFNSAHSSGLKLDDLVHTTDLTTSPTHGPSSPAEMLHPAALCIAVGSIAAKEALYRSTMRIGRKVNSNVLIANAWHHRSDAITSVVATAGIGLSLAGLPICDPLAGIGVGGVILKTGIEIGMDSLKELCDGKLPDEVIEKVESIVSHEIGSAPVQTVQVRGRRMGRLNQLEVMLDVQEMGLEEVKELQARVKKHVMEDVPRTREVLVEIAA